MYRMQALLALPLAACVILAGGGITIPYDPPPLALSYDFGAASGSVPDIDCSNDAAVCNQLPQPPGTRASCELASRRCILESDVRVATPIDLANQASFPEAISTTSARITARVNSVTYWGQNNAPFALPAFELYAGPAGITRETDPGVARIGSFSDLAAQTGTACSTGTPGTEATACSVTITADQRNAFARFSSDFRTPFTVLVVGHLVLHSGDPLPRGTLSLTVAPHLGFVIGG